MADYEGIWTSRIKSADEYFRKWDTLFQCKRLWEYRRGFQYEGYSNITPRPYTMNMIYSTLEIKLSTYSFSDIKFNITPRPMASDFNKEQAILAAQLKEDTLNTLVQNPNIEFQMEIEDAIVDSYFRYGIIEVGYSADWITNPNGGKPLFEYDLDQNSSGENVIREPDKIPVHELIFFKRIPANHFRVGGVEGRYLRQCNWYGYYDFYYADDIKNSPILKNTEKITTISHRTTEEWLKDGYAREQSELLTKGNLLKIWKLWDNRAKNWILWDEANDVTLYEAPFTRQCVFDLRHTLDDVGWYPIPPAFQWISPQDEINEARQQMRSFRRRFVSQFQVVEGSVDEEEVDKFQQARDGAIIKTNKADAIQPIQNGTLNSVVPEAMMVGKDDFILISGTSAESMGVADRITATQSSEISRRFAVRESREQIKIARFLAKIGREGLAQAQEKMILGLWIKSQQDPESSILMEMQANPTTWNYVLTQDLTDGVDYDVNVSITSMSPVAQDDEKKKYLEFLAVITQFPQVALSPMLIRETAYMVGYRNEQIIREMQKMALLTAMGQMAGNLPGMGNQQNGNQTSQQIVAQKTPPTMDEMNNQLRGQISNGVM